MHSISSEVTFDIINSALEVYKELGYGHLEVTYRRALAIELRQRSIKFEVERKTCVLYKGQELGDFYIDLFVENSIIIELKTVSVFVRRHFRQVKQYMRSIGVSTALIFNFGPERLVWHRVFV